MYTSLVYMCVSVWLASEAATQLALNLICYHLNYALRTFWLLFVSVGFSVSSLLIFLNTDVQLNTLR